MKIDPNYHGNNCSPINVLFNDVYITFILLGILFVGVYIKIQWVKMAIFNLYTWKYLTNGN